MRDFKLPFNLYDFFGYLMPGFTLIVLVTMTTDIPVFLRILLNQHGSLFQDAGYSATLLHSFLTYIHGDVTLAVGMGIFIILSAYTFGHLIAAAAGFLLERLIVENGMGFPAQNLFVLTPYGIPAGDYRGKIDRFWGNFSKVWLKPLLLKIFTNYSREYHPDFIERFRRKYRQTFQMEMSSAHDVFWLTFEYIGQHFPTAFERANHFINLYGFSRNLAMSFLISAFGVLIICLFQGNLFSGLLYFLFFFLIAGVLFWNYLKLFKRLNDEIFRAFLACTPVKSPLSPDKKRHRHE
ncbi:MAG: hypothetical protein LCH54_18030 [Bacteroidetes bacterium]|nr:hypothetical protein [Bacteroidota bacterium]